MNRTGDSADGAFSGKACLMNLNSFPIQPLIALIAGVLILFQPRLLNYIVAIYLIIVGVIGLAPGFR
jgi:threonine/homoserine efflux transporter RhtA